MSVTTHPITQCHVPEDLNPKIRFLGCAALEFGKQSHETLAAASYQTTWRYTPEYDTLHIHCCKNP
jgi:hypothetical protein